MSGIGPQELTPLGHALAGALGGVFSNGVIYPLDTVKTRIQAAPPSTHGRRQLSIISIVLRILRKEGVTGFYGGFFATMLNTFSQQYAYFFFYSLVRLSYIKRLAKSSGKAASLSTAAELSVGAIAGALAQIFTIPVSVIATRQQIGQSLAAKDTPGDNSFLGVGREIVREEGITGLWLGIKPGLVLTVNPAITYGVYERIKSAALAGSTKKKLSPWTAFALGAASKTLATIVTYPYIMAKVRIQARADVSGDILPSAVTAASAEGAKGSSSVPKHKHPGALDILARVWRDEGFLGWYQGMEAQIIKAVLAQALLFMSKDQFEHYALVLLVVWARVTRRFQKLP